jgi:hypothetical protein
MAIIEFADIDKQLWIDSKGAIIEHTIAMYLGLKVRYEAVS